MERRATLSKPAQGQGRRRRGIPTPVILRRSVGGPWRAGIGATDCAATSRRVGAEAAFTSYKRVWRGGSVTVLHEFSRLPAGRTGERYAKRWSGCYGLLLSARCQRAEEERDTSARLRPLVPMRPLSLGSETTSPARLFERYHLAVYRLPIARIGPVLRLRDASRGQPASGRRRVTSPCRRARVRCGSSSGVRADRISVGSRQP